MLNSTEYVVCHKICGMIVLPSQYPVRKCVLEPRYCTKGSTIAKVSGSGHHRQDSCRTSKQGKEINPRPRHSPTPSPVPAQIHQNHLLIPSLLPNDG